MLPSYKKVGKVDELYVTSVDVHLKTPKRILGYFHKWNFDVSSEGPSRSRRLQTSRVCYLCSDKVCNGIWQNINLYDLNFSDRVPGNNYNLACLVGS